MAGNNNEIGSPWDSLLNEIAEVGLRKAFVGGVLSFARISSIHRKPLSANSITTLFSEAVPGYTGDRARIDDLIEQIAHQFNDQGSHIRKQTLDKILATERELSLLEATVEILPSGSEASSLSNVGNSSSDGSPRTVAAPPRRLDPVEDDDVSTA